MESVIQPEVLERYKEEMRAFARRAGYTLDPPETTPASETTQPAAGAGASAPTEREVSASTDMGVMPPAENPAGPLGEQFPLFPVEPMMPAGNGELFDDGL